MIDIGGSSYSGEIKAASITGTISGDNTSTCVSGPTSVSMAGELNMLLVADANGCDNVSIEATSSNSCSTSTNDFSGPQSVECITVTSKKQVVCGDGSPTAAPSAAPTTYASVSVALTGALVSGIYNAL